MSRWYVDTSAVTKVLVAEAESEALAHALDAEAPELVACFLLETEVRRVAHRVQELTQEAVTGVLAAVDLYEVPASLFREAGLLAGPELRSLDAVHLAAAVRIGVEAVLTYDTRMADAARSLGLVVTAPGQDG